jgi:hypothetical protein
MRMADAAANPAMARRPGQPGLRAIGIADGGVVVAFPFL